MYCVINLYMVDKKKKRVIYVYMKRKTREWVTNDSNNTHEQKKKNIADDARWIYSIYIYIIYIIYNIFLLKVLDSVWSEGS
jgi:hypothetical protein